MGCDKLSHILLDLGCFSVLGTTERSGGNTTGPIVERGKALTWDYNNGVLAVYDEKGRPWIMGGGHEKFNEVQAEISRNQLKRGAHVPHSNDGGRFIREVLRTS